MSNATPTLPDVKKLGEARLAAAAEAKSPADWKRLWKEQPPFPFKYGTCWKACFQYAVKDFASELGFFIDVLGFDTNAFSPEYAMLTDPEHTFTFAIVPADKETPATPIETFQLGFMVKDLEKVAATLAERGVTFAEPPAPYEGNAIMLRGALQTPNGVRVEIWDFKGGK